jgi:hypothetical protein
MQMIQFRHDTEKQKKNEFVHWTSLFRNSGKDYVSNKTMLKRQRSSSLFTGDGLFTTS